MAAALQYGRERALLGRSLLNFMRIARDAHAPDLTLGEVGDLLFSAMEVFIGHAFERPVVLSELSRNPQKPRVIKESMKSSDTIGILAFLFCLILLLSAGWMVWEIVEYATSEPEIPRSTPR